MARYLASREVLDETEPELFGIWPGNEQALDLFLATYGSWRYQVQGGFGVPVGIDESAIHARMQVMNEVHNLELFDDAVAMGRVAADVLVQRMFGD